VWNWLVLDPAEAPRNSWWLADETRPKRFDALAALIEANGRHQQNELKTVRLYMSTGMVQRISRARCRFEDLVASRRDFDCRQTPD